MVNVMENKTRLGILAGLLLFVLSFLVVSTTVYEPTLGNGLRNYSNISGIFVLNASNTSISQTNGTANHHLIWVNFSFVNQSTGRAVRNVTIFNTTPNQSFGFLNSTFNTTELADAIYNVN